VTLRNYQPVAWVLYQRVIDQSKADIFIKPGIIVHIVVICILYCYGHIIVICILYCYGHIVNHYCMRFIRGVVSDFSLGYILSTFTSRLGRWVGSGSYFCGWLFCQPLLINFDLLAFIWSNLSIQYKNFHWANTAKTSPIRIFSYWPNSSQSNNN
jgi:hypothetical protein